MWRFLQREWKKVMPKLPKSEVGPGAKGRLGDV